MSWEIKKLATDVAYKAVSSLEGAGIFAVELFLTEDGQVVSSMLNCCKIVEIVLLAFFFWGGGGNERIQVYKREHPLQERASTIRNIASRVVTKGF